MDPTLIVLTCLGTLITMVISWGVYILKDLSKSIEKLNTSMAIHIEKTAWHEKAIDENKKRIFKLENTDVQTKHECQLIRNQKGV